MSAIPAPLSEPVHNKGAGVPEVEWSADVEQTEWIRERLDPFESGEATSVVPPGFPAYARILHPARDSEERPIRREEIALGNGLELRPGTQFPEIALLPTSDSGRGARELVAPEEGTLSGADASALIDILARHTPSADRCWFCVWDGYGWDQSTSSWYVSFDDNDELAAEAGPGLSDGPDPTDRGPVPPVMYEDPVPRDVRNRPRVELPHRTYFLYRGSVEHALAFVEDQQQTPNLWWAQDRAWCVASELDLDWTYIGGSQELIDEILGDDRLEALRSEPTQDHHLRLPPWLVAAIESATDQVLAGHPVRVDTSLGTVTAAARRPGLLRRGELRTTSVHPDGDEGTSWTRLSGRDLEGLRDDVRHDLSWAVLSLIG